MKLGVCIVKSHSGIIDPQATITSVKKLPVSVKIHYIDSFLGLQDHFLSVQEDWTLVLYERERLDLRFIDAIQVMLAEEKVSAYKFYCVIKTPTAPLIIESVRLFRKGVCLRKDSLRPSLRDSTIVKILDGWIYEHGTENDICSVERVA